MRRTILIFAMTCCLGLFACGGDDDGGGGGGGGGGGSSTVQTVCGKIFECFDDHYGWDTEELCTAEFLADCVDSGGYLTCMDACVAGACDDFKACEMNCYSADCE